jgi:D-3-phosphoglycerate dehydrogenase
LIPHTNPPSGQFDHTSSIIVPEGISKKASSVEVVHRKFSGKINRCETTCLAFTNNVANEDSLKTAMPAWKIMIADDLDEKGQDILRTAAQVDDCQGITPEALYQKIAGYHALIVRSRTKVTAAILNAGVHLKVVGRAGVGVDNIDLAAAAAQGVTVVNAPISSTLAVAEQTLALMFALARAIPKADTAMKSGLWIKKELQGIELNRKVLGIIGVGNIGGTVATRAAALGMTVLGHDPLVHPENICEKGAKPATLTDLYSQSDFISLHAPLSPETRGMIDGQALSSMKRGVYLICTARGGLIDETALIGALESGQVIGAALDVFEQEPPGLSALVAHPNVIATPHISAQTTEAQERAATDIATEVLAALQEKPLRWRIV